MADPNTEDDIEHAAPYYPPQAEAKEVADFLAAFADRYPHMWPTTRRKILWAAESLRFQVQMGYAGSDPPKQGDPRGCTVYGHSMPGRCPNCGRTFGDRDA